MFGWKKPKKTLTVGLIHGNRPLVEAKIRAKEKVLIGAHPKNTFVIHSEEIPKRFVMFEPQGNDRYLLSFLPRMKGKIAVKDKALSLAILLQKGVVETKKGVHQLSISDKTRGKITFGAYRLL